MKKINKEVQDDSELHKLNYANTSKKNDLVFKHLYKAIKKKYLILSGIIIFILILFYYIISKASSKSLKTLKYLINDVNNSINETQNSLNQIKKNKYIKNSVKESLYDKKNKYIKNSVKESLYDKKGKKIYSETGSISFNKLDEIFYNKSTLNNSKFDHIHLAMSFNNNYSLLSTVSIASLLKNSNPNTYIHLHIIAVDGWVFPTMKKINSLKYKINNNSEFIFHNGERAIKDFGNSSKGELKGVGEYARLLAPYFVNETDRLIITDSADLFFEKDLLELYNYPLEDKFIKGTVDPFTPCFPDYIFFHKENYFNGGVLLVNAKKWREMDLYQQIVIFYNTFQYKDKLPTPIQDILNNFFPAVAVGNLPLRYNFQGHISSKEAMVYPYNMIYDKDCSIFYQKKDYLLEEEKKIFIRHTNKYKVYWGEAFNELKDEWKYYAKLTGFYEELCKENPKAC